MDRLKPYITWRNQKNMHKKIFLLIVLSLISKDIVVAQQLIRQSKFVSDTWHNPVLNNDFPDPTVIRAANGKYYAYATQGSFKGKFFNIQVASSDDMFHWRSEGDA